MDFPMMPSPVLVSWSRRAKANLQRSREISLTNWPRGGKLQRRTEQGRRTQTRQQNTSPSQTVWLFCRIWFNRRRRLKIVVVKHRFSIYCMTGSTNLSSFRFYHLGERDILHKKFICGKAARGNWEYEEKWSKTEKWSDEMNDWCREMDTVIVWQKHGKKHFVSNKQKASGEQAESLEIKPKGFRRNFDGCRVRGALLG